MSRPTTRPLENRAILAICFALLGSGVSAAAEPDASSRPGQKPNIIFIMADDLGYAHLGCYGQEKIRTPELDVFAAEGMRFTQCYAGAPVCAPSRSVLMTGLHCGHTSVRGNSGGIPLLADDVTVAEVLGSAGYRTGIFGKWGLGRSGSAGVPNEQGFDRFFGYLHQVHCHFYYPYYLIDDREKFLLSENYGGRRRQYTHDVIVERALEFVRESKDRPFFLYVPFTIPHTELLVPEDSLREYRGKFPEPTPWVCPRRHYADQPTPRAAFAAMVTRMDRDVGRILTLIEELGLDSKTIVFFTSDNGGQDGGGADLAFFDGNRPLRGSKGQVYEGGIRVPMVVRWPGHVARGTANDHVWAFCDVLPTLAELGGARTPSGLDGVSAAPTLLGPEVAARPQPEHRFLYWEQPRGRGLAQGVRMGDWKAVRLKADGPLELYNLMEDIGETTNVAAAHPAIVAEIEEYLKDARVAPRRYKPEPPAWGYPKERTGYFR